MIEMKCSLSELFTTLGISDIMLNYVGEDGEILYRIIHAGFDNSEFESKIYNEFIRAGKKIFLVVFAKNGVDGSTKPFKMRHSLIVAKDMSNVLEICRMMGKTGYEQYKIKPDTVIEVFIGDSRKRWEMLWYNPIAQEDRVTYILASSYEEALRAGIFYIMRWAGGDAKRAEESISALHTFDGFFDVTIEDAEAAYNKVRSKHGK